MPWAPGRWVEFWGRPCLEFLTYSHQLPLINVRNKQTFLELFSKEGGFLPVRPPVITNVYSYQETEKAADFARKWKVHMEGIQNFLYDIIEQHIKTVLPSYLLLQGLINSIIVHLRKWWWNMTPNHCKVPGIGPFRGLPPHPWRTRFSKNIARGTTDPGHWLFNLGYLSSYLH